MIKLILFLATAALATVASARGAGSKLYPAEVSPRVTAEWRDSADHKISVCFSPEKTTFYQDEDAVVRCWVRNNTAVAILLLYPFGDANFALSAGLTINGPNGRVDYHGSAKDYVLGTSDFLEVPAKSIVEQSLMLFGTAFPDLKTPGLYSIVYLYQSGGYPRSEVPANLWQGQVQSASAPFLISAKKR